LGLGAKVKLETIFIVFASRVGCDGVPGLQWPSLSRAGGVPGLEQRWEELCACVYKKVGYS